MPQIADIYKSNFIDIYFTLAGKCLHMAGETMASCG